MSRAWACACRSISASSVSIAPDVEREARACRPRPLTLITSKGMPLAPAETGRSAAHGRREPVAPGARLPQLSRSAAFEEFQLLGDGFRPSACAPPPSAHSSHSTQTRRERRVAPPGPGLGRVSSRARSVLGSSSASLRAGVGSPSAAPGDRPSVSRQAQHGRGRRRHDLWASRKRPLVVLQGQGRSFRRAGAAQPVDRAIHRRRVLRAAARRPKAKSRLALACNPMKLASPFDGRPHRRFPGPERRRPAARHSRTAWARFERCLDGGGMIGQRSQGRPRPIVAGMDMQGPRPVIEKMVRPTNEGQRGRCRSAPSGHQIGVGEARKRGRRWLPGRAADM